jgi:hypothetical protein
MSIRPTTLLALLLAAAACGDKRIGPIRTPASATADAGRPPTLTLPDGGVPGGAGGSATCATETVLATRTPADLLFLVDVGPTIHQPFAGGTESKFLEAKKAMFDFLMDPRSAGLGVGLQFFPFGFIDKPCVNFRDCGRQTEQVLGGTTTYACTRRRLCALDGQPAGSFVQCPTGMNPGPCECFLADLCGRLSMGMPTRCIDVGECDQSHEECYEIGKPCPGGAADGMCVDVKGRCNFPALGCDPTMYESLAVPITDLPAAAQPVLEALNLTDVQAGFGSPLSAAVQGTTTYLRRRTAQPGARPAALVVVTEGKKTAMACSPDDPLGAVAGIEGAARATPSLPTYVIGVLSSSATMAERDTLNRLATAGGTGAPIVLDSAQDAGPRLLAALEQVRSQALPCELAIPTPRMGALDYRKVNVTITSGAGAARELAYVVKADACQAAGGWYYDADPAAGGKPTSIRLCPATCEALKGDAKAKADLTFGCATRTIE